jgi:hydrogenase expression/formation protein HypD
LKYLDEYRGRDEIDRLARLIAKTVAQQWVLMEICGGQTHTIVKYALDQILPETVELVHGPGCPVCVTPMEIIDQAIKLASKPEVIFCSYGDMLRVPGSERDLLSVKASGGDVRTVYSPLDALAIAVNNPLRQVVFFAVGFETTAPAHAITLIQARKRGIENLSMLVAHVCVPPAMKAILSSPSNRVQGFLAAGHVCTVTGFVEYEQIAAKYRTPIVVTGFEPVDILTGVLSCIQHLEQRKPVVDNQYKRVVQREGNAHAQEMMNTVFETSDRVWRGIGMIPASGLRIRQNWSEFDAVTRFTLGPANPTRANECIAGEILQGHKKPPQCPAFGSRCTPERPLGAPMVSTEGACAAYYRYRRQTDLATGTAS